ncbi:MAG: hypothetical protein AAF208_01625, partial [Cyanobacteria bacterium P01_A01_bin.45]
KNIAKALESDKRDKREKPLEVRVIINSTDYGEYAASQQTWLADEKGAVVIEIKEYHKDEPNKIKKVTELIFRETWWADLGKSSTLGFQLSFWKWGLSLWSRKQFLGKKDKKCPENQFDTLEQMELPKDAKSETPSIKFIYRLRFFVVSWVVLLVLPVLYVLNAIFRRFLGIKIPTHILEQYLGDVKHYQQKEPEGAGSFVDIGKPPRISVRRRMVTELVKMRLGEYDRWYVLAHSLGTVVAFNGLMEADAVLPNYLNQELWEKCQKSGFGTKTQTPLTEEKAKDMSPRRPAWLELDDIIAREGLFKNLRGVMTYGSPLSKFAVVWPAIVPINRKLFFPSDFEWINVYDPTDPVADETKYFNLQDYGAKEPIDNIAYKADSIHLVSHIKYLDYNPKRKNPLVRQLAYWLLKGDNIEPRKKETWGWPTAKIVIKIYQSIRYLIWLVLGLLISWMLGYFASWKVPDSIKNWVTQTTHLDISNPLLYLFGTAVIVFFFGIFARLWDDSPKD